MSQSNLKRSGAALWSLIFGITSIAACWIFASVPAIVLGCIALGKTSGPNPERSGQGMAKTGILTGCIGTVIGLFSMGIWVAVLDSGDSGIQQRIDAQLANSELNEINTALRMYSLNEGTYPRSLQQLVPLYLASWDTLALYGSGSEAASLYQYRLEGFRTDDPTTSPVVLTPRPIDADQYGVIYADGRVGQTNDPEAIRLFH